MMNFHVKKKEDYVVLALALTLTAIVLLIGFISLASSRPEPPEQRPIPTPTNIPIPTVPKAGTHPLIQFDTQAQERLLSKVTTRPELTPQDTQAKTKILALLPRGEKSGVLYETKAAKVEYVSSADLFMVEIKTIDIAQGKADANIWFRSQGASQQGICNYPVMFYLNSTVLQNINSINIKFSPVATSC